jgi:hypothetical protein
MWTITARLDGGDEFRFTVNADSQSDAVAAGRAWLRRNLPGVAAIVRRASAR